MCCVRAMATVSSWVAGVLCSAKRAHRNSQQRLPSCMGTAELGVLSVGTARLGWWLDWVIVEVFCSLNDSVVYGNPKAGPGWGLVQYLCFQRKGKAEFCRALSGVSAGPGDFPFAGCAESAG